MVEVRKVSPPQFLCKKDRWENGEIDILEYIRSQNGLEDSRVQLINLKTSYMELLAEYLFEVGKWNTSFSLIQNL